MRARTILSLVASTSIAFAAAAKSAAAQTYQLTVTAPAGGKISDGADHRIECGEGVGRCRTTFTTPTTISLWVQPSPGYVLEGGKWIGCTPTDHWSHQECRVTVDGVKTATYEFVKKGWVPFYVEKPAHGKVVYGNDECPTKCQWAITKGTKVSFLAVGDLGWVLESWGADCSNRGNPCVLLPDDEKHIAANFKPVPTYTITITRPTNGTIFTSPGDGIAYEKGIDCGAGDARRTKCSIKVTKGVQVKLYGQADPGHKLGPWQGACDGTPYQMCIINPSRDQTVTRTFP